MIIVSITSYDCRQFCSAGLHIFTPLYNLKIVDHVILSRRFHRLKPIFTGTYAIKVLFRSAAIMIHLI